MLSLLHTRAATLLRCYYDMLAAIIDAIHCYGRDDMEPPLNSHTLIPLARRLP